MNVSALFSSRILIAVIICICPVAAFAQAPPASGDYTTALPSVEKVKAQIQGPDPTDTTARQVAVFEYLQIYIQRIKSTRDYRGSYSPGELKLLTDYAKAQFDLNESFKKSHTPTELSAFQLKEAQYSINNALDWIKQLQGQQAADTYKGTEAELAASSKRFHDKIQQDLAPDPSAASHTVNGQGLSNDPTAVATRRCLELGGDNLACVGKSFVGGLMDMITGPGGLDALTGPGRAGVVLSGTYGRAGATNVSFSADSGTLGSCGVLVDDGYNYTLTKSATALKVTLATSPNPVTLTMRSDGSLSGPGLVTINGRIITGYEVVTHYVNGAATGTTRTPVYGPKTDRCTIGALAAPPPAPPPGSAPDSSAQMGGMLGGLLNTVASVVPFSLPGLRIEGKFGSSGLLLDFAGDAVTIDCGAAHVKAPYTVENAPTALVVHVQNSGGPFDLVVSSNNALRGSGSTAVNGRLVSGMNGDNVTFTPHSERCAVASFTPQSGTRATTRVAATASPAPASLSATASAVPIVTPVSAPAASASTGGSAQLRVLLSSEFTGTNPLANQAIFVARKPMDQILRELDVAVPANATPAQAMKALQTQCHSAQGCTAIMQKLPTYYVTTAKFDSTGKATLAATAATGQYYFFAVIPSNGGTVLWDIPANLAAGDNNVTFTQANSERLQ